MQDLGGGEGQAGFEQMELDVRRTRDMSKISWNTKKFYEGMQRRRAEYELHGKSLLPE